MVQVYVVTYHSLYLVTDQNENGRPSAEKIEGLPSKHTPPEGYRLRGGTVLAIGNRIIAYTPGRNGNGREIEKISRDDWGDYTSSIIGLFKKLEDARKCLHSDNKKPHDERWLLSTRAVLKEIGENNPWIEVCHHNHLASLRA